MVNDGSPSERMSRPRRRKVPRIKFIEVVYETSYYMTDKNLALAVSGSCRPLGCWDPEQALVMHRTSRVGWWRGSTHMHLNEYYEWKLVVYDIYNRKAVRWEEREENRWDWLDRGPIRIIVSWNRSEVRCCLLVECTVSPCRCLSAFTALGVDYRDLVLVKFVTTYIYTSDEEVLAISGSGKFLGNWDTRFARQFNRHLQSTGGLTVSILVPPGFTAFWKLVLIHRRHRTPICWEDRGNRYLSTKFHERNALAHRISIRANWNEDANELQNGYTCERRKCALRRTFCLSEYSRSKNRCRLKIKTRVLKHRVEDTNITQYYYDNIQPHVHGHSFEHACL